MKKQVLLLALSAATLVSFAQTKTAAKKPATKGNPAVAKFGALAVDRKNGFYYGWSFDYATLAEAEQKAVEECVKKGGNCTVVLSYSGTGCAAYRTINGEVGTAYGWGVAKTKAEADAIATRECLKRSNGISPANFVWSCNSAKGAAVKEIYNASEEIEAPVKIGNQVWMNRNLDVATFRNGDPIAQVTDDEQWRQYGEKGIPAWCYPNNDPKMGEKYGRFYNWHAVNDRRGLAPAGYRIPTKNDFDILIATLGGGVEAIAKLKSKLLWKENKNGTNTSGLNIYPVGFRSLYGDPFDDFADCTYLWASTTDKDGDPQHLSIHAGSDKINVSSWNKKLGFSVRLIKD